MAFEDTKSTAEKSFEERCHIFLEGRSYEQLLQCRQFLSDHPPSSSFPFRLFALLLSSISVIVLTACWSRLRAYMGANPCLIPTNFILMEMTRPIASCEPCKLGSPVYLHAPTVEEFAPHAYAGRPVLVSGAAEGWRALEEVDYAFLRRMYGSLGANGTAAGEDGCQFLAFRSQLETLEQLMNTRTDDYADARWYIGWSNCDPRVAVMLRGLYSWPDFLPPAGEWSAIDWIFMGTPGQGTAVHIDNVHRPSWQAQIRGAKRWRLFPPPECEHVCKPFSVDVHRGEILLLDTNQWYHGTEVISDEMSITIGSEYD